MKKIFLLLSWFLTATCVFAQAPIASYNFDATAGTTLVDKSGTNNGIVVGGATWITGHTGNALHFNGIDGLVSIPHNAVFNFGGTFTVSFWFKTPNQTFAAKPIITKRQSGGPYTQWGVSIGGTDSINGSTGKKINLALIQTYPSVLRGFHTNADVIDGNYHYLAWVNDGSSAKLYLDAVAIPLTADTTVGGWPSPNNSQPIKIAENNAGSFTNVDVDDLRIYSRALSLAEIQSDMNTPIGGTAPPIQNPPIISNLSSTPNFQATIVWTTDQVADSQVDYGLSASYGLTSVLGAPTTQHSIILTGLMADTTYHYRARSRNAAGDLALSPDATFSTGVGTAPIPPPTTGSALASLAASMQPGTWAELVTSNISPVLGQGDASGNIISYAMSSAWDPVGKRIYLQGQDHANTTGLIFARYDETANAWADAGPIPNTQTHAYDHMTIDPVTRTLYLYKYLQPRTVASYPIGTSGPWADLNDFPQGGYLNISLGLEWFPGVGLVVYNCGDPTGELFIRSPAGTWTHIQGFGNIATDGGVHCFAEYSAVHNVVLFGGPSKNNRKIWRLNSDLTVTAMPDAPHGVGIQQMNVVAEPVSGDFLAWGYHEFWEFNPTGAGAWHQLANLPPGSAPGGAGVGDPTDAPATTLDPPQPSVVSTSISSYGVVAYTTCRARACNVYLYKHAAGPVPPVGGTFVDKCSKPGVLGCWPFDDPSELKYTWDNTNSVLNDAMAGKTRYSLTPYRYPGEGNTVGGEQPSGAMSIPVIDNTLAASGAGSLKFTIPSQSGAGSGYFQDNYNKTLGNPSLYIAPGSPYGNVIYLQYKLRVNDVMLNTKFHEYMEAFVNNITTPSAGSTTLNANTNYGPGFTVAMQGRHIAIYRSGNWVPGIYTINTFVDANTVILDRTPTPSGASTSGGVGFVEGTFDAGGWKTAIQFGNAPNGSSSSVVEITMNDAYQLGYPQMYGQQGHDSPPMGNLTVPFVANQWMEITTRIEVLGAPNDPSSHVQWWVNGVQAGDWTTAKIWWGLNDGDGLGQFLLSAYHTRKDPTQIHDTGYMWFDDVIASTQPIAMGSAPPQPQVVLGVVTQSGTGSITVSNPCITDPLRISGVKWPAGQTGSRSLSWSTGTKSLGSLTFKWPATLTITDTRACTATVTK